MAFRHQRPVYQPRARSRCAVDQCDVRERRRAAAPVQRCAAWDILPLNAAGDADPEKAAFTDDVFGVLGELLAIPHDACRESALHGLGHSIFYNAKGGGNIDTFLARERDLRPELIAYAKAARTGCIL